MNKQETIRCERCNEILNPNTTVWLELSNTDGKYYRGNIPKGHTSQGAFAFGRACAVREVAASELIKKFINEEE